MEPCIAIGLFMQILLVLLIIIKPSFNLIAECCGDAFRVFRAFPAENSRFIMHVFRIPFFPLFNRVLKNKNQAVRQGARRYDKRSIFKHM